MKWWHWLILELLIIFGVMAWIYFFPSDFEVDFAKGMIGFVLIYAIEKCRDINRRKTMTSEELDRIARAEEIAKDIYIHYFDDDINYPCVLQAITAGVQKGAEFGYNKANEWHYVKDGLPPEDGRYLICNIFSNNYVATNIAEFNSKNGIFGCIDNSTIYAWKEIIPPKESE